MSTYQIKKWQTVLDRWTITVRVKKSVTNFSIAFISLHIVKGYLHLTRVKSTNSKKYSKGKIQG